MKINIIMIIILFSFFSCNKKENRITTSDELTFFNPVDLGARGSKNRIIISAKFDECGEWGGHKETLEVLGKEDNSLYLKYSKNKTTCDNQDDNLTLIKEIKLDRNKQNAIINYLNNLMKNKIQEGIVDHSGKEFSVLKTDSSFYIHIYDNNSINEKYYDNLLEQLHIEK